MYDIQARVTVAATVAAAGVVRAKNEALPVLRLTHVHSRCKKAALRSSAVISWCAWLPLWALLVMIEEDSGVWGMTFCVWVVSTGSVDRGRLTVDDDETGTASARSEAANTKHQPRLLVIFGEQR